MPESEHRSQKLEKKKEAIFKCRCLMLNAEVVQQRYICNVPDS